MVTIERLDAAQARAALPGLVALLQDAVASGASVGFLPPLDDAEAHAYWQDVIAAVQEQTRILLVARHHDALAGTVQLDLAGQPNGRHRAEVMKLMVHRTARRQGLGRALLAAIEEAAREAGRSLLVLDTRRGDVAEQLYRAHGYSAAGVIPWFARGADGALHDTVYFYRWLGPPPQ
jgi:GNAT superfamily N-acetyltransferase